MKPYAEMSPEELTEELEQLRIEYKKIQALGMHWNMSRGIPCQEQTAGITVSSPASRKHGSCSET